MRSTMAAAAASPAAIRSWPGWPNTTPVGGVVVGCTVTPASQPTFAGQSRWGCTEMSS